MERDSIIVITGASGDLGLPLVDAFLAEGRRVWGLFHSRPEILDAIVHPRFRSVRADLTKPSEAEEIFREIAEANLRIHLLINLVGPFDDRPLGEITPVEWASLVSLNLNTVFTCTYFARPLLISHASQIINFTFAGVENIRALPNATAYAAAKAGVAVLTKSLAADFGSRGIRVNAVAPGWIDHPNFSEVKRRMLRSLIPLGQLGATDEVVKVVRWLANDAPTSVTGATINVGGGWEF